MPAFELELRKRTAGPHRERVMECAPARPEEAATGVSASEEPTVRRLTTITVRPRATWKPHIRSRPVLAGCMGEPSEPEPPAHIPQLGPWHSSVSRRVTFGDHRAL